MKKLLFSVFLTLTVLATTANTGQRLQHKTHLPQVHNTRSKIGLAWSWMTPETYSDALTLGTNHHHKWNLPDDNNPISKKIRHFACQPHYYDGSDQIALLQQLVPVNSTEFILFYNEPDLSDQCNQTPLQAVNIYEQVLNLRPNVRWVGAQVSHTDYLNNWVWLREFYTLINQRGLPMPYAGAIHTYIEWEPMVNILNSYEQMAIQYGAPTKVWVTEFGTVSPTRLVEHLNTCYTDPRIEYCYYYAPRVVGTRLIEVDGSLNSVGQAWVNHHTTLYYNNDFTNYSTATVQPYP